MVSAWLPGPESRAATLQACSGHRGSLPPQNAHYGGAAQTTSLPLHCQGLLRALWGVHPRASSAGAQTASLQPRTTGSKAETSFVREHGTGGTVSGPLSPQSELPPLTPVRLLSCGHARESASLSQGVSPLTHRHQSPQECPRDGIPALGWVTGR